MTIIRQEMGIKKESLRDQVLRVRLNQISINKSIGEKKYAVPIHLALGHEAISVAVSAQFKKNDQILLTHRNLHYHLAYGVPVSEIEDVYMLTDENSEFEKLGSMNLTKPNVGNIYTSNILGNNLLVGLGVALSEKILRSKSVTWIISGDGALEEGALYESLLNAASLNLNIIYIIENNSWSLATSIQERRFDVKIEMLCQAFGIGYALLKSNDVVEYNKKIEEIRTQCISNNQPQVVEVQLSTLGYYKIEDESVLRTVNYHSGYSKAICDESGVISRNSEDPVYVNLELTSTHD